MWLVILKFYLNLILPFFSRFVVIPHFDTFIKIQLKQLTLASPSKDHIIMVLIKCFHS